MKRASICPAALLALPLATAVGAAGTASSQSVVDYNLVINNDEPLIEAFLFIVAPFSSIPRAIVDISGGTGVIPSTFSFTDNTSEDFFPAEDNQAVFLGVYDNGTAPQGLSVSLIDADTLALTSPTFSTLFDGFNPNFNADPDQTEIDVIENLIAGDFLNENDAPNEAVAFVNGFAFPSPFGSASLGFDNEIIVPIGNFSTLTLGGSLEVSRTIRIIPEPASVALLGLGGLMLAGRRRRVSA